MKSVRAGLGVLLLGALCATASPTIAQSDDPLGGVTVILEQEVGRQFVARGITGRDGRQRFYIPAGDYAVTLTHVPQALAAAATRRAGATPSSAQVAVDRTVAISIVISGFGTGRERRVEVGMLSDSMEAVTFQTRVSSPVSVTIFRHED